LLRASGGWRFDAPLVIAEALCYKETMRPQNLLRMGFRAAAYLAAGVRCPVNVMLAVTNRCNGCCSYCRIPTRPGEDLPTARVLSLVDEMAAEGTVRLGIWGGEPLMREDIGRIVDQAKMRGMYVTMDSNGLLWEERWRELMSLDHVTFAVDGDRQGHDRNRGRDTYDKVMKAVELVVSKGGPKVWTLTVLTRNNLHEVDAVITNAKRLGIHCAFQILHHNEELGQRHGELMPGNDEYREVIQLLIRRKEEGAPICSSSRYLKYLLAWPDYRKVTTPTPHCGVKCKAGALYCNIDADGTVYACSLMVGKTATKSVMKTSFRDAFNAIPELQCQGCTAACFTEYNYLYSLDPACILEWMRTTRH
jgi:MoaA/NifB/PqqE/SkfB family radical SAM enzyme